MENYEDNNSDEEENRELGDEDFQVDEYANLNEDIDITGKKESKNEDDDQDNLFDFNDDYTDFSFIANNKRVKTTNYSKMTKFEYAKIYGKLAEYIRNSNIEVPEELLDDPEVKSGDEFRISRLWINKRHQYPLPVIIVRGLYNGTNENIRAEQLLTEDELSFKDDNDDSYKFHYNFRDKPYETAY